MKKKIAVFASGSGSNFEAIAKACLKDRINAEVVLCVCDHPGAGVTQRAKRLNISVLELVPKSYSSKAEYEGVILRELKKLGVEFICLAGYMRIVGETLLNEYEGKIINIHPSLLPSFPGVDAIGQALNYGVKVFGITVHYVDQTLDGGKIISQAAIPYDGNDREELEAMIHPREHVLYVSTLKSLLG
ncbi:MAG: phosphoribosylglycinamide formyltransferase [Muribaculaceae bacterium]|nr:phosphoribosylglycinamide formyltransferase [Muribaculaceae bacterium]